MALQNFADGTTHYCKFERTALCENALHYDNKTTINIKSYVDFQKKIFKDSKIETHLSIFRYFAPYHVDL